jgi:cell division protein FtsQ
VTATAVRRPGETSRFAERVRRERRRRWVRRVLILIVLGAIVGGGWAVGWSTALGVRQVTVEGEHRTTARDVTAAARIPHGRPMLRVDLRAAQHRVEALPTVAHADVLRVWPHTVRIVVIERVPVAVVRRGTDRRFVAADGVDFAPAPDRTPYPVLDLDVAVVARDRVTAGLAVLRQLPFSVRGALSSVEVFDPTDIRLLLHGGTTVYWGSAAWTGQKAQVLRALERTNPQAKTFDVSAPDAPTVRR